MKHSIETKFREVEIAFREYVSFSRDVEFGDVQTYSEKRIHYAGKIRYYRERIIILSNEIERLRLDLLSSILDIQEIKE